MSDLVPLEPRLGLVEVERLARSAVEARTDDEAARLWLHARGSRSGNTFDSYSREARRLLLWLDERGTSLREMTVEDAHRYYDHLGNPPEHWLRPRKPRRNEPLRRTQLLVAGLNAKSVAYARTVLMQMCNYLQKAGYLHHNVFYLSSAPLVIQQSVASRSLDIASWNWLKDWIAAMPRTTSMEEAHAVRARWLAALLYHSGIRREEVSKGLMSHFVRDSDAESHSWKLAVVGKGGKLRYVTVNSSLLNELVLYRSELGIEPMLPTPGEQLPLVVSLHGKRQAQPLTPRAIGMIFGEIAQSAARACEDPHIRARLEQTSTHWMRHTNATHRLKAGASLETTQDELGHADPKTTRIYAEAVDEQRREDAEKLAHLSQQR